MQFDHTYRQPWPENLKAIVEPVFLKRRALGLSVQFMTEEGNLDEWQFADVETRDRFIANQLAGKPFALSA
jgi:hypothetical protein